MGRKVEEYWRKIGLESRNGVLHQQRDSGGRGVNRIKIGLDSRQGR